MSAQPGFPRCARYSVLRRDLGPKPRPKVHLRWRTGDWTALLPVLNEKYSSKSPPRHIRPIPGEFYRNPYSRGAGPAPMRRHHRPHQSPTVARKGGSGGIPTFTGAQSPSCPAGAGLTAVPDVDRDFRESRIRIERWDRICGWARVPSRTKKIHYRTTGEERSQPGGRRRAFPCYWRNIFIVIRYKKWSSRHQDLAGGVREVRCAQRR
jgi:hypothetical protein